MEKNTRKKEERLKWLGEFKFKSKHIFLIFLSGYTSRYYKKENKNIKNEIVYILF